MKTLTKFNHKLKVTCVKGNITLDEINKIKKERNADIERMADLEQKRGNQLELERTEIRLEKLLSTVHQNLDNCGAKDKRLAFDALDIKAVVTKDRIQVQGVIPMDLVTIE